MYHCMCHEKRLTLLCVLKSFWSLSFPHAFDRPRKIPQPGTDLIRLARAIEEGGSASDSSSDRWDVLDTYEGVRAAIDDLAAIQGLYLRGARGWASRGRVGARVLAR